MWSSWFSSFSNINTQNLSKAVVPTQSQDVAPALTLVGQSARPRHEGQIAILVRRIPQIGYTLEARAPQQAGFPVREGVKALAAVVRAHPTGTCQRHQERLTFNWWGLLALNWSPTYRHPRTAEPPSGSAGCCHWSKSFHWRSHSLFWKLPVRESETGTQMSQTWSLATAKSLINPVTLLLSE